MASFQAFTRFSLQNLSSQDDELRASFSKARHVREAQCSVVPPEVHDRLVAVRRALVESYSKLQHETKAIGRVERAGHTCRGPALTSDCSGVCDRWSRSGADRVYAEDHFLGGEYREGPGDSGGAVRHKA
ncbi:hypothetical protein LIER_41741 [Lithospermum erythrorhizon]|uniref:Uncharacterized protein n=1 Tax=Lithospermum erythrorhizon TaxID=34254 RepID=A0AAV3RJV7_LITER